MNASNKRTPTTSSSSSKLPQMVASCELKNVKVQRGSTDGRNSRYEEPKRGAGPSG